MIAVHMPIIIEEEEIMVKPELVSRTKESHSAETIETSDLITSSDNEQVVGDIFDRRIGNVGNVVVRKRGTDPLSLFLRPHSEEDGQLIADLQAKLNTRKGVLPDALGCPIKLTGDEATLPEQFAALSIFVDDHTDHHLFVNMRPDG